MGNERTENAWYLANQENLRNWRRWLTSFEEPTEQSIRPEAVYKEINRIAERDAIFVTDVGNTTIHSIRLLNMTGEQLHTTSGWFATMGNGIPGGIAAKLSFPRDKSLL